MLRFKEARKFDYIDNHLAANLITFLVFWSLEQFDQALKYATSCRWILKKIISKRGASRGSTERPERKEQQDNNAFLTDVPELNERQLSSTTLGTSSTQPATKSKFSFVNQLNLHALIELAYTQS